MITQYKKNYGKKACEIFKTAC